MSPAHEEQFTAVSMVHEVLSLEKAQIFYHDLNKNELEPQQIKPKQEKDSDQEYSVFEDHEEKVDRKRKKYKPKAKTMAVIQRRQNLNKNDLQFIRSRIAACKISEREFKCRPCNKTLHSYSAVRYHLIAQHLVGSNETCNSNIGFKENTFDQKPLIKTHKSKVFWDCYLCFSTFASKERLRYHNTKYHEN